MKNNIDIWFLDKKLLYPLREDWHIFLSEEEKSRANKFHFSEDKSSFALYHACKRLILADYLNQSPQEIIFSTQEKGKPFLQNQKIKFNLSHTKEMAMLAVAVDIEVGIDIEKVKTTSDYLTIAKRFFHLEEYEFLKNIGNTAQQQNAFFEIWTAKEAVLKATGEGIAAGMNTFNVQTNPIKHNSVTITLSRLKAPAAYKAAIAALSDEISITYRQLRTDYATRKNRYL